MLSCKVSVINANLEHCTMVLHAHSRAAFDLECGYQISAIKVDSIKSEDD